jgi:hypothetical protein
MCICVCIHQNKHYFSDQTKGKNICRYGKQSLVNFVYFVCASQQNHSLLIFCVRQSICPRKPRSRRNERRNKVRGVVHTMAKIIDIQHRPNKSAE